MFEQPIAGAAADEPASPVEKEIARTVNSLRDSIEQMEQTFGIRGKHVSTQTQSDATGMDSTDTPFGYAVPPVFIRSVAEAVEQAVIAYCSSLTTTQQRQQAMQKLLQQVGEYIWAPRNLFVEVFETAPTWYDYVKVSVFDCVTSNVIGSADILPPSSSVIVPNVNIPLYESAIVTNESIPHLPQVEISLVKFSGSDDVKNRVVAQSVIVPLDLFVTTGTIVLVLDDGQEREISYKAELIKSDAPLPLVPN